jgi:cell wall-associated NlpC family hydrolase
MTVMSPDQVAAAVLQASHEMGVTLTRDELVGLVSIPSRESGYDTHAYNGNRATGDDSYGLWQINMLGSMGNSRRQALGIRDNTALFDPVVSAKAAIQLVLSGRKQGDPLHAWGGYKGLSNTYNVSPQATSTARSALDRVTSGGPGFLPRGLQSSIYSSAQGQTAGDKAVLWARQQIGKPYKFASTGPDAFDCSGLTSAAYSNALGVQMDPLSFTQAKYGIGVSTDDLQPGDLLLFHGSQGNLGHVAMYSGNGKMIEAPFTGAFVREVPLDPARVQMARRVVDANGAVIVGGQLTPRSDPSLAQVSGSSAAAPIGLDMMRSLIAAPTASSMTSSIVAPRPDALNVHALDLTGITTLRQQQVPQEQVAA